MLPEPLDELYFIWLARKVAAVNSRDPSASYWKLMRLLYQKEFVWTVPNDDNRAEDGRELRWEFAHDKQVNIHQEEPGWVNMPCSMLELLIGLSRRLAFEDDGEPLWWFWHMLENLDLEDHRDGTRWSERRVDRTLDVVIWRTYAPDGYGGLFPLKNPEQDQRHVELWYQLSAYLLEREQ